MLASSIEGTTDVAVAGKSGSEAAADISGSLVAGAMGGAGGWLASKAAKIALPLVRDTVSDVIERIPAAPKSAMQQVVNTISDFVDGLPASITEQIEAIPKTIEHVGEMITEDYIGSFVSTNIAPAFEATYEYMYSTPVWPTFNNEIRGWEPIWGDHYDDYYGGYM